MCLALPGKVLSIHYDGDVPMGEVDFSGVTQKVCLIYTPDVPLGGYVIVHVGFSISVLDEKEAEKTLELFQQGTSA